jgi:hypothetical protein
MYPKSEVQRLYNNNNNQVGIRFMDFLYEGFLIDVLTGIEQKSNIEAGRKLK